MNNVSPTRVLVTVLAIVVGGGAVLYIGNSWLWTPYQTASNRLQALEEEVGKKERDALVAKVDKANVAKWNKLSLPKSFDQAVAEYGKMLKPLLRDCGLQVEDFQGPPAQEPVTVGAQKKPRHISLSFQVRAKGTIASLAKTLEALQRMPVMHRVKTLVMDRADAKDRTGKLGVQMTIEALIVAGADNQPKLGGLSSLDPAPTKRDYAEVALRNPFVGLIPPPPPPPVKKVIPPEVVEEPPPPSGPDVREFIRIDTIVPTSQEAFLRNYLYKSPPLRLRSTPMSGYDTFRIMDENRERVFVKGKVLRIDARDIYFQVGEDVYRFHFDMTLAEAMERPLDEEKKDELGLTKLVDEEFAKQEADAKKAKSKVKTKKGR